MAYYLLMAKALGKERLLACPHSCKSVKAHDSSLSPSARWNFSVDKKITKNQAQAILLLEHKWYTICATCTPKLRFPDK